MKLVEYLLLSSVTSLITIGGAQAADLPLKAKPAEYVKVCSLYGAGFYYIPGSDTCLKLGGYMMVDVLINSNSDDTGNTSGAGGAKNRFTNAYTWRGRADLNIDTRTATEYGVVRTYFDAIFGWDSGTYSGTTPGATVYNSIGGVPAPGNAGAGVATGGLGVYYAFIQFAGFTMGKAVSQFSTPWTNYPGNTFDGLIGGGGTITGVNQFTYTAELGEGVSLTISAQDQVAYYQAGVNNINGLGGTPLAAFGAGDYSGTKAPDIVGVTRVAGAWGAFQASFAAHDNAAAYYDGFQNNGGPSDKWGWAGQLALSINNIPTGVGDTINVTGVYTDGATRYNIQDLGSAAGANTIYGNTSLPGAYQSIGFGMAPDTVFGTLNGVKTGQQTVQTWGARAAFSHNWDPHWSTSIYGAYAAVTYNDTSKQLICGDGVAGGSFHAIYGAGVTRCNPDYNITQIGIVQRWTPVKNLTFSADLTYTMLDQKMSGTISAPAVASIGKPGATYELKDQNTLLLLLRARRNW